MKRKERKQWRKGGGKNWRIEKRNNETNEEGKKEKTEGNKRGNEMRRKGGQNQKRGSKKEWRKERNKRRKEGKEGGNNDQGNKVTKEGMKNIREYCRTQECWWWVFSQWVDKTVTEKVITHSTNTNPHWDTVSIQSFECNERLEQVWSVTTKPKMTWKKQHESHLFRRRGISGVVQHCPLLFTVWSAQSDQWCVARHNCVTP